MTWFIVIGALFLLYVICALYWRFIFFFRDPEREPPPGRNIVAPADGTIVYTSIIEDGDGYIPITIKKGKKIRLDEITKTDLPPGKLCHVGIFMDFFNVHVNRVPIAGKIKFIKHFKHEHLKNLTMNWMGLRKYLGLNPFYKNAIHIWENERKTVRVDGDFPIYVIQIADAYVDKIFCWAEPGEMLEKGQRYGRVAMGSQVDIVFPYQEGMEFVVKERDKVKAGESIIATY